MWVGLSPAGAGEGDDVVGFEAVVGALEGVGECFGELRGGEVGGEVSAAAPLCPDFVAGMEELGDELLGVLPEECLGGDADVVEAHVGGAAAVKGVVFLDAGPVVVGVAVEVVVDGVVVNHFGDGDIEEEVGIVGVAEVFGEELHEECLADAFITAQEQGLGEFVAFVGEDGFGDGRIVEVMEEEEDDDAVVVVDDEFALLRSKDNVVGDVGKEAHVDVKDEGVGKVGELGGGCADVGLKLAERGVEAHALGLCGFALAFVKDLLHGVGGKCGLGGH